jgi:hypothetical protein
MAILRAYKLYLKIFSETFNHKILYMSRKISKIFNALILKDFSSGPAGGGL